MSDGSRSAIGRIQVFLGKDLVGNLVLQENDRTEFRFDREYLAMYPRPILGQHFEDDLEGTYSARLQVPPFFSNLLPEARLRELVAARLDVSSAREAYLLAYLGEDLPGNVRAVAEGELPRPPEEGQRRLNLDEEHPIKFSLAGMQPKLSMLRQGRSLTFPASGRGGDWIVKLPNHRFDGVPQNEFATMTWARASGITVPEFELTPVSALENLPPELASESNSAFAVRRFDRPKLAERVHIEDFAQVLNEYGTHRGKYEKANYETIAAILLRLHQPSFVEFVRRLAFVIVSANGDAHIKNWSLWYPDRVHAELAPAYDFVSTIEFLPADALGLNLAKSKKWSDMRLDSFTAMARRIGADEKLVETVVTETVRRALETWSEIKKSTPVTKVLIDRLETHWKVVPLVQALG